MKIITYIFIGIIKFYKIFISPIFPSSCRFEPTCSQYCIDSLKTFGLIKGLTKSISRIAKCNPWFGYGGFDPVKKEKKLK
tara:strand:+ start:179 stop:418 length:240 start_codon:yes stop_codon:yes gene_type:complete